MRISVIVIIFFLFGSMAYAQSGKVIVQVDGFRNTNGYARITLFKQSKGFPSEYKFGLKSKSVKLAKNTVTFEFDSLVFDEYALSVMHDENENGRMDTNLIGIPKEGYGVSNNVNPRTRAPRFEEAKFSLSKNVKKLRITLNYR